MAISLQKGQRVSLKKQRDGLNEITIGLGWGAVKRGGLKGIFNAIVGKYEADIDCDAAIVMLSNGRLTSDNGLIYYRNKHYGSGAVVHHGDNLVGNTDSSSMVDCEQISIILSDLPMTVDEIIVFVAIYEANKREQTFGGVNNAFIRIVDEKTNTELCKYNLNNDFPESTCVEFGRLIRGDSGEWDFKATGEGSKAGSISEFASKYRVKYTE